MFTFVGVVGGKLGGFKRQTFLSCRTHLLYIVGELAGGGSVAVAVGIDVAVAVVEAVAVVVAVPFFSFLLCYYPQTSRHSVVSLILAYWYLC